MKMANTPCLSVYKTPTAERKLIEIIKFSVRKWGKETTIEYIDQIDNIINSVACGDLPCQTNPDFSLRFSYYMCKRHYIFFEFKKDKLIVVSLFHTAMDIKKRLNDELTNLNPEIRNIRTNY